MLPISFVATKVKGPAVTGLTIETVPFEGVIVTVALLLLLPTALMISEPAVKIATGVLVPFAPIVV